MESFVFILFNFIRCLILISELLSQNRFITIYGKRDEDGTKRKLHQSPEISQPRGCTLARK